MLTGRRKIEVLAACIVAARGETERARALFAAVGIEYIPHPTPNDKDHR